jgi:hypothetical protein
MAMPNDYFVIEATDLSDLATKVVEQLNTGCELVGGVSGYYHPDYNANGGKTIYLQALIDKTHNKI